jgi:hypothetical protein
MNVSPARLFWQKIWCLVTSKLVLLPSLIGAGALFFSAGKGRLGVVGLVALGFAVFGAAQRWFAAGDDLTERAWRDLQGKARQEHAKYLRELRRALRGDRDLRTSNMLKKLQRIHDRLLMADRWQRDGASEMFGEIRVQANDLYQACLRLLERSLEIWQASRDMATESARQQLRDSREQLVTEVQNSIDHLEQTLDHIQTSQLKQGSQVQADATRLREELDEGLTVARQVEERMSQLEVDLESRHRI